MRIVAAILALILVTLGAGVLAWGVTAGAFDEPLRLPLGVRDLGLIYGASEVSGWGGAVLGLGLTTLALAFLPRRAA